MPYLLRRIAVLLVTVLATALCGLPAIAQIEPLPPLTSGDLTGGPPVVARLPGLVTKCNNHSLSGCPSVWDYALSDAPWCFQLLPDSLIYKAYLAGPKESRMSGQVVDVLGDSTLWEATLGAHVGIFRYGNTSDVLPQGFQVDVEGAAQVRLDIPEEVDVRSVDFRAGVPLTWGYGRWQTKFAYYHLSSHLADEFLLKHPGYPRLNYSRDVFVLGQSIYLTLDLRLYAEVGWAFHSSVAEEWEFQFGVDYAPGLPTGIYGAPFFAVNGQLREELDFGGNFTVQTGWAWRGDEAGRLLRIGFLYYNGQSDQFSFYRDFEQKLGFAVWYDF